MAEEKKQAGRKTPRTSTPTDKTTHRKRSDGKRTEGKKTEGNKADAQAKRAPSKGASSSRIPLQVRRALPIGAVVLAFVSIVLVYRWVFPPAPPEPAPEDLAPAAAEPAAESEEAKGVEDPWTESGTFTMGITELDYQIKTFCDALSLEDYSAEENAQAVYNAIVWSTYAERTQEQKPAGNDWDVALTRSFLSTGNPEMGEGGKGDAYEFAATTSFCLRYFGFEDAMAVPVLRTDDSGNTTSSALVLVTNSDDKECVCDPSLGADGWMLKRSSYDIVVENLGQDVTKVKEMGFKVKESPAPTTLPEEEESTSSWGLDESAGVYEESEQSTDQSQDVVLDQGSDAYVEQETYTDTDQYQDQSYDGYDESHTDDTSYSDSSDGGYDSSYDTGYDSGYVEEGTQYDTGSYDTESYGTESYDSGY